MPTPRSESINKYLHHETDIRHPIKDGELANRVDHYAVLAQVIDYGVEHYLNTVDENSFLNVPSLPRLASELRNDLSNVITTALDSPAFEEHFNSLHGSVQARQELSGNRWNDIKLSILAGSTTFADSFTYIFDVLQSRFNPEIAAHENNWQIADRLAKLNITQSQGYYGTYLTTHKNWSKFIEQLDYSDTEGVRFKKGFPLNAYVTVTSVDRRKRMLDDNDFTLDGEIPVVQLKDLDPNGAIGCPITFNQSNLKSLWRFYAHHAHRIVTTPLLASSGGNEELAR